MRCLGCGHDNPAHHRFCCDCGRQLARADQPAAEFPAPSGERKIVTVMFCDIVGSTPLAARLGEDRMFRVVNEFMSVAVPAVYRYEGDLNTHLGDGFMALFGAPIAREDHARRAALAALAVQEALGRHRWSTLPEGESLKCRVGLHTGPVVFGRVGDGKRMEITAIGDTANVAARLQGEAEPGTVACSEDIARALRGSIECRLVGARILKGKEGRVDVYRLVGPETGGEGRRVRRDARLVGRDVEWAAIEDVLADLSSGAGGFLALCGEAGAGKTRLLEEMRGYCARADVFWVQGQASDIGQEISFHPFRGILEACLGNRDIGATFQGAVGPSTNGPDAAGERPDHVEAACRLLRGLPARAGEMIEAGDAQDLRSHLFASCRRAFEGMARQRPMVVALEDWQRIDSSSAELLGHLMSLAAQVPLLVVLTARSDAREAAGSLAVMCDDARAAGVRTHRIDLAPLSESGARAFLAAVFGSAGLPANVAEHLIRRAGGNPLFLGELAHSLIESGAVEHDARGGAWVLTSRFMPDLLPDTVEGILLERIDRLPATARDLLRAAAVLGNRFPSAVLADLGDWPDFDADLTRLLSQDLLSADREASEDTLEFRQPLVRKAAYDSLLEEDRRLLHRRAGLACERFWAGRGGETLAVLAHHFACAEDWDRAQEYLIGAALEAGRIAADAEALALYGRALNAAGSAMRSQQPLRWAELGGQMAEALFRLGRHEAALELAIASLDSLGIDYPTSRQATYGVIARKFVLRLLRHALALGKPGEAREIDERHRIQMRLLEVAGNIDYYVNPPRFALSILSMLERAERRPLSRALVVSTAAAGLVCDAIGFRILARRMHARAVRSGQALGEPGALGYAETLHGLTLYAAGQWDEALGLFAAAADRLERAGHVRLWATAVGSRYLVMRSRGDPGWIALAERQMAIVSEARDEHALAWAVNSMGVAALYVGDFESAMPHFDRAVRAYEAIPDFRFLSGALARHGLCLALAGRWHEAMILLGRSRAVVREHGVTGLAATASLTSATEAYLWIAEQAQDPELRTDAMRHAHETGNRLRRHARNVHDESPAESLRLDGVTAWLEGDRERAMRLWRRSAACAERMGALRSLALAHDLLASKAGLADHRPVADRLFEKTGSRPMRKSTP